MKEYKEFNDNDILRFLYDEMESEEHERFLEYIVENENILEDFENYSLLRGQIDQTEFEPSVFSCDKVMHFAKSSNPHRVPSHNYVTGKNKFLNMHHLASVAMVLFTSITIGWVMQSANVSKGETIVQADSPHLEWNSSLINTKIEMAKHNLRNISGEREAVVPFLHNTYRLVKTESFSGFKEDIVLLNLR